jgi:hypothetical protein
MAKSKQETSKSNILDVTFTQLETGAHAQAQLARNAQIVAETIDTLEQDIKKEIRMNESILGKYARKTIKGLEPGFGVWTSPGSAEWYVTLNELQNASKTITENMTTPLYKRGLQVRCSYIFGEDIIYKGLDDEEWWRSGIFSAQNLEKIEQSLFIDGNVFLLYDKKRDRFFFLPLSQVSDLVCDSDDTSDLHYIQRTFTPVTFGQEQPQEKTYLIPVISWLNELEKTGKRLPTSLNKVEVSSNLICFHLANISMTGDVLGIPDGYPALLWAMAYNEYLAGNADLVKALVAIAWKVSTANKATAATVLDTISSNPKSGGTAVYTDDNVLSGVGVPSSQVNFNNGERLASMVAASFGIPTTELLVSMGQSGGNYGANASFQSALKKGMQNRQRAIKAFQEELIRYRQGQRAEVIYPAIEQEQIFRTATSVQNAFITGALHHEEYRNKMLELLDILPTSKELPTPNEFIFKQPTDDQTDDDQTTDSDPADEGSDGDSTDNLSGKGKSGSIKGGTNQGITDHGLDEKQVQLNSL